MAAQLSRSPNSLFQHGFARVVASVVQSKTRLTKVQHQSPSRLLPISSSLVAKHGSQLISLSNYGGGMLQGDTSTVDVRVEEGAKLAVVTQGANRIYKNPSGEDCETKMTVNVHKHGLLVYAPDPCCMFGNSKYKQNVRIDCQSSSDLIWIDLFTAGRIHQGEAWSFDKLTTRTSLYVDEQKVLVDALHINGRLVSPLDTNMHVFGSVVLHGKQGTQVAELLHLTSRQLAAHHTAIRGDVPSNMPSLNLGGRVALGLTQVGPDTHVVRLAAQQTEDIYRVLYSALQPLKSTFGVEIYKDRLQSTHSSIIVSSGRTEKRQQKLKEAAVVNSTPSAAAMSWASYLLADSSLPTGAFAHSSGIEAASQLDLLCSVEEVEHFVLASTQSAMQLLSPFVQESHAIASSNALQTWMDLDRTLHLLLVANGPACRASLDQGQGLLRVAKTLLPDNELFKEFQQHIGTDAGHFATLFGLISKELGVTTPDEACGVLQYCLARDVVSAAVRLNLVGPLASLSILRKASHIDYVPLTTDSAAGSSPMLEVVQPHHDILAMRLFRT
jgi:urease accessory protein UreH/urease accessory protein UreF